jgi:hypothetical protein
MTAAPARAQPRGRHAPNVREQSAPDRPGRGGGTAARALAWLALVGLVAVGATIAVAAAGGPSPVVTPSSRAGFPAWFAGPLAALTLGVLGKTAFWLLVFAMSGLYLIVLALLTRLGARAVVGTIVALHAIFALAPPLLSTDAFGYLAAARSFVLAGASPYAPLRDTLAGDPVLPLLVWSSRPNPYGPLFTAATLPLAWTGIAGGLWVLKVAAAASSLGLVAIVASAARRRGRDPVFAAAFVGLNPVVLAWVVGGAHNDTLLMLLVVGSLSLVRVGRELGGGAVAAAAVVVKASVGLLVPILVLGAHKRTRALVGVALALAAAGVVAFAVLGSSLAGFPTALADQAALHSPNSILHVIGKALGLPGATPAIRAGGAVTLVLALLVVYARTARGADPVAAAGWASVATLLTTSWLMPWYVIWVLPLAALTPGRALRAVALGLCAFVIGMRASLG